MAIRVLRNVRGKRGIPVRKGKTYCSPWCNCGCTYKEYRQAMQHALQVERVMGKGWKIRVWENTGWHFDATRGLARLSFSYRDKKWAAELFRFGANDLEGKGETPREALHDAILIAVEQNKKVALALMKITSYLVPKR